MPSLSQKPDPHLVHLNTAADVEAVGQRVARMPHNTPLVARCEKRSAVHNILASKVGETVDIGGRQFLVASQRDSIPDAATPLLQEKERAQGGFATLDAAIANARTQRRTLRLKLNEEMRQNMTRERARSIMKRIKDNVGVLNADDDLILFLHQFAYTRSEARQPSPRRAAQQTRPAPAAVPLPRTRPTPEAPPPPKKPADRSLWGRVASRVASVAATVGSALGLAS